MGGVRDRTRSIDEAALYILLNKARSLTANQILQEAWPVRRQDLLARPREFRGRLVRLKGYYAESQAFMPLNRRQYDRQAYSTLAWERDDREAISLVTVDDPGRIDPRTPVELAGYFLKLRRDERRQPDEKTGDTELIVPVLVGKAVVVEPRPTLQFDMTGLSSVALVAGIALLAGLWFMLRSRIRRVDRDRRYGLPRREPRGELPRSTRHNDSSGTIDPDDEPIDLDAWSRGDGPGTKAESDSGKATDGQTQRRCLACGALSRDTARFCDQCGASLEER